MQIIDIAETTSRPDGQTCTDGQRKTMMPPAPPNSGRGTKELTRIKSIQENNRVAKWQLSWQPGHLTD